MLDVCLTPTSPQKSPCGPSAATRSDAGIFFSDIVIPMKLAGVNVDIVPGRGPYSTSPYAPSTRCAPCPNSKTATSTPSAKP